MSQTLLKWVRRVEVEVDVRKGGSTSEAQRVEELEREVKALRRADGILKLSSAFSAYAKLDCGLKSERERAHLLWKWRNRDASKPEQIQPRKIWQPSGNHLRMSEMQFMLACLLLFGWQEIEHLQG